MIMKIILTFIDPLVISIFLLILSIYIFKRTGKKLIIYLYLIVFYLLNTAIISESLLYHYERQIPKINRNLIQNDAIFFVFGGGAYDDNNLPISSRPKNESTIRMLESVLISNTNSEIILSGRNSFNKSSEAKAMYDIIKILRPEAKVKLDENSTNSKQQIEFISKLNYKQIVLISSASHIPRIKMLAEKYNIENYILAPTEHKIKDLEFEIFDFFPNAEASDYMREYFYEIAAYLYFYFA